jgi:hypothetical protein
MMKILALLLNIEYGGPDTMRVSELPSESSCCPSAFISGSLKSWFFEIERIGSMLPISFSIAAEW